MPRVLLLPPASSLRAALAPLAQHDIELADAAELGTCHLVLADLAGLPADALAALGVPQGLPVLVVSSAPPTPAHGCWVVGWLPADAAPAELCGAVRAAVGAWAACGGDDPALLLQQAASIAQKKDEFISHIAHDLKNPMASIKGYADLMRRRSAKLEEDPNRKGLEIISTQVSRMTMLLDQLLDFSRISLDRMILDSRPIDLVALAQRLVEDLQATAKRHTLQLVAPPHPVVVLADETRIRHLLDALLQNAMQFSPQQGTILISVASDGGAAVVRVVDRGVGIPPADLPHIFEPFYRASNVEESRPGAGVGLFVAQHVAQRHQGQIVVESVVGEGSTFTVCLPLVPEADAAA